MAGEISDVNLMESPPDKAVLVGDVGVGKTSLFMRFKTDRFVEGTTHNPKEGEFRKKWTISGREVSVSWATCGRGHIVDSTTPVGVGVSVPTKIHLGEPL